jgi:ketosteroid isomerase-like protein
MGLLLLALFSSPDSTLRRLDSTVSAAVAANGLASGLAPRLSDDVLLLYAGAPVVRGRAPAIRLLANQPVLDTATVTWGPNEIWTSADGRLAVILATSRTRYGRSPTTVPGVAIVVWRRSKDKHWMISAAMLGSIGAGADPILPADMPRELPPVQAVGAAAGVVGADLAFAAAAGETSAGAAFRQFAATEAVLLGPGGPHRGPDAVAQVIGEDQSKLWQWAPVAAEIAASGDLGFTIGQSMIADREGANPASLGKYLTVWVRTPDGFRFLTDGGNRRPGPAVP